MVGGSPTRLAATPGVTQLRAAFASQSSNPSAEKEVAILITALHLEVFASTASAPNSCSGMMKVMRIMGPVDQLLTIPSIVIN